MNRSFENHPECKDIYFFAPAISSEEKNLQGTKLKLISLEKSAIINYNTIHKPELNQIQNCIIRQNF